MALGPIHPPADLEAKSVFYVFKGLYNKAKKNHQRLFIAGNV